VRAGGAFAAAKTRRPVFGNPGGPIMAHPGKQLMLRFYIT
jgi:hypothetical protein